MLNLWPRDSLGWQLALVGSVGLLPIYISSSMARVLLLSFLAWAGQLEVSESFLFKKPIYTFYLSLSHGLSRKGGLKARSSIQKVKSLSL